MITTWREEDLPRCQPVPRATGAEPSPMFISTDDETTPDPFFSTTHRSSDARLAE